MSTIKAELINYINNLPDYKLFALKPMFEMILTDEVAIIEKVNFEELDEEEKQAILQGRKDFEKGDTFSHDEIDWENLEKMDLG